MVIDVSRNSGVLVIRMEGRTSIESQVDLRSRLKECLDSGENLVLTDLEKMQELDSATIGAFMQFSKRLSDRGGHFVFAKPSANCLQALKLLSLHELFKIYETEEAAMEFLAASSGNGTTR